MFCGGDATGPVCFSCRADLPRVADPCGRCNQPLRRAGSRERPNPEASGIDCADCQQRPPPFHRARAAVLYEFPVDVSLKAFKFGHALYYVPAFAELLLAEFLLNFEMSDALVPVPLHRLRYATRGFNQAAELCRHLGKATGTPVVTNLRRTRWTRPQSNLDAASRRRNLKDAFAVVGGLDCRHPLIVDDVMTTGETARQLARTLMDAGAETVNVLTVARAAD
ncbi:MAG TPA: ComF family protein [Woeseiaceae bacterium]|nr:ComF family protein [Woeseiaceae bacterium]